MENPKDPSTPRKLREFSPDFVAMKRTEMRKPSDPVVEKINRGEIAQSAIVKICIEDPAHFNRMVSQGLRLDRYPGIAKGLCAAANPGTDIDRSMSLLRQAGASIDWATVRTGAKNLTPQQFLVLMKHGPSAGTTAGADTLAGILADNPRLIQGVVGSASLGVNRDRLMRALASLRPEARNMVAHTPPKPINPLVPKRPDAPLMGR